MPYSLKNTCGQKLKDKCFSLEHRGPWATCRVQKGERRRIGHPLDLCPFPSPCLRKQFSAGPSLEPSRLSPFSTPLAAGEPPPFRLPGNPLDRMILHLVVAAAMAVATSRAWPISPLGDYLKGEVPEHYVNCDETPFEIRINEHPVKIIFNGTDPDGTIPAHCTASVRVDEQDFGVEKYGLWVTGEVDLRDKRNIGSSCSSSSVVITDMDDDSDETGEKEEHCGQKHVSFHTSGDAVNIKLNVGAGGAVGKAFTLLVQPHYLCGGTVSAPTTISSPDYPGPYPRDILCVWYIRGNNIELNFNKFELQPQVGKKCKEYVEIQPLGEKHVVYCGNQLNGKVKKYKRPVFVHFRSAKRNTNRAGFSCSVNMKTSKKSMSTLLSKFYEK
ncbi:uncharacterized protein LOC122268133 [Penaeus japonicus]|uniref:uncharacterized protein LOC122268133 n=1 Tax=Penaeus japonicus TaxID=27405 RepID=UPI001C71646A|nr:uncharacterized protein LOC122268133 [Penaeus japonicus]